MHIQYDHCARDKCVPCFPIDTECVSDREPGLLQLLEDGGTARVQRAVEKNIDVLLERAKCAWRIAARTRPDLPRSFGVAHDHELMID
jgi:hypothetical protein